MAVSKVAYRYAQALLDLAKEQNILDKINGDMEQLAAVSNESKDFQNLLRSPIVDSAKKINVINAIFESKMEKMSLGFVNLIVKNSREGLLPEIATGFVDLYKKDKNILDVTVISAIKLDAATKETIVSKIKAKFDGTIEINEQIDPELLGGFIVRIDDQQIDASIASQLTNLKNILLN